MKNYIIYMISPFEFRCGGIVVQYELAKTLHNMGINIKIMAPEKIKNSICNEYYNGDIIDKENTVVIYGETIKGNPLNAKYVIRWILAPLGLCSDKNIYKSWGDKDLVYYFNAETKFTENPDKIDNIYKSLNILYINPLANNNKDVRKGYCHTFRKSHYHNNLQIVHPPNSFELKPELSQIQMISIFNKYKYFISYDPLTFISILAALCGCISIVKKVDNMTKDEWLSITSFNEYIKETGTKTLYGIAYGIEEVEMAKNTLHLVKAQWNEISKFMIKKNVNSFLKDMENYETQINMVMNNYV